MDANSPWVAALLAACSAVHAGALAAWFGALSLERVLPAALGAGRWPMLNYAAALALASAALWAPLQTAAALGDLPAAFDAQQVVDVMTQSAFGRTWLARTAVVALAVLASLLPRRDPSPRTPLAAAIYALVATALASLALLGHAAAASGAQGTLERTVLALHLLAGGAWLGALPVLWILAARLEAVDLADALARFSRYGLLLVALVVAAGVASAAIRLGHAAALLESGYGRVLLFKIALVALMGVCALANRNRYAPRLRHPDLQARQAARRGLRASIGAEAALGALVIVAASVLGAVEAPQ